MYIELPDMPESLSQEERSDLFEAWLDRCIEGLDRWCSTGGKVDSSTKNQHVTK